MAVEQPTTSNNDAVEETRMYWDDVLYKPMAATIRGSYYGVITQDELDEELFNIAKRAINTFKFPRVKLDYKVFYAVRDDDDEDMLNEVEADNEDAVPHGYFVNKITDKVDFIPNSDVICPSKILRNNLWRICKNIFTISLLKLKIKVNKIC